MSQPPRYLIIGRVLKPWSYRGELKIEILTDFPDRFASLRTVFLGDDAKSFSVERARRHGNAALLKLNGIDSTQAAEKLRNQLVQVAVEDAVRLPKGQHYLYQLIGLRVKTLEGETLGEIVEILDTGANDVYVVRASAPSPFSQKRTHKSKRGESAREGSREILIPAIEDVVKEIDLERGEVIVQLIEGLI